MADHSQLIAELSQAIDLANRRMFAELAAWQVAMGHLIGNDAARALARGDAS